ncbi:hypothetical protein Hanom_Chr06g00560821 [Helianthus anomalus]
MARPHKHRNPPSSPLLCHAPPLLSIERCRVGPPVGGGWLTVIGNHHEMVRVDRLFSRPLISLSISHIYTQVCVLCS